MLARSRALFTVVGLVTLFSVGTVHANQLQEASSSSSGVIHRVYESVSLQSLGDASQIQGAIVVPEDNARQTINLDFASATSDNVTPDQFSQRVPEPPCVAFLGSGLLLFRFVLRAKYQLLRGAAEPV